MAISLDRLERLFSYKRKISRNPSPNGRQEPKGQFFDQQFPSPSFIRPKTSRMTARQEVRLRQATDRSPSVPDVRTSQCEKGRMYASVPADTQSQPTRRLARPPSTQVHTEDLVSVLREFRFPKPPGRSVAAAPLPTPRHIAKPAQTPRVLKPRCEYPLQVSVPRPYRSNTPPSSDPEDDGSTTPSPTARIPHFSLSNRLPTPERSPEIGFVHEPHLRNVKSADCLDNTFYGAIEDQLAEPFDHRCSDRTCSQSQSSISQSPLSLCSSTLREPDFNEFLSLSDDDIAELAPESPILAPVGEMGSGSAAADLWISSSEPLRSRLLTLSPPRASHPATAAAFEAARIARRYDFDLVYVVNLWPNASCPTTSTRKPMIGRLLAAHGLHHVPSPLEISEEVHTTILRSDGWVEYRDQEALADDIARGYACAFHTGQYKRPGSPYCAGPVSGVRLSERIDRGIVFAAYRKPRANEKLGRTFGERELGQLHRDAEALVEMVLDIHATSRSRRVPLRNSEVDDIGPIPTQQHSNVV